MRNRFFTCDCGKWGYNDKFDERIHFVKCPCGKLMYLTYGKPEEIALREKDKVETSLVKQ